MIQFRGRQGDTAYLLTFYADDMPAAFELATRSTDGRVWMPPVPMERIDESGAA